MTSHGAMLPVYPPIPDYLPPPQQCLFGFAGYPMIMNECSTAALSAAEIVRTPTAVANGGQVHTLSPTAGDGAGGGAGAGDTPAGTSSSSSAAELSGDAEGVWSADIDQAFQEALAIYPPCGRRKIIISDEGKMYGRNELIARYIKIRCGKTRTRKQVSSHIQVLARKKLRDDAAKKKAEHVPCAPAVAPIPASTAAPAPLPVAPAQQPPRVPATVANFPQLPSLPLSDPKEQLKLLQNTLSQQMYGGGPWPNSFIMPQLFPADIKPFPDGMKAFPYLSSQFITPEKPETPDRLSVAVVSSKLQLNSFTAYVEIQGSRVDIVSIPPSVTDVEPLKLSDIIDKYPKLLQDLYNEGPKDAFYLAKCWANVHFAADEAKTSGFFAVDSYYTSTSKFDISVSTKVSSFGEEQVEKVEDFSPTEENGLYTFRLEKSPMCDYMVRFIYMLKELENEEWMNNVLENFTVLQVITNKGTGEILMVLCFTFEVNKEPDTTCSLFKLTA